MDDPILAALKNVGWTLDSVPAADETTPEAEQEWVEDLRAAAIAAAGELTASGAISGDLWQEWGHEFIEHWVLADQWPLAQRRQAALTKRYFG